jgi:hypothetical protein
MTPKQVALCAAIVIAGSMLRTGAVTRVNSANGQFWDIQDISPWGQDGDRVARLKPSRYE